MVDKHCKKVNKLLKNKKKKHQISKQIVMYTI